MFRAVSFDLWNTLIVEGPDGLVAPRLAVWAQTLRDSGREVSDAQLTAAHEAMFIEFQASWKANRQFVSGDAAAHVCGSLGMNLSHEAVELIASTFDVAGRSSEVKIVDGALRCLDRLRRAGMRTVLICDVGLVPSTALRAHMDEIGLSERIDQCVFSDDVGTYKPDVTIFERALASIGGVAPVDAAHVGDRVRTDVIGALATGIRPVRFAGVYDDPDSGYGPPHDVIQDLMELPPLLGV